MSTTSEQLNQQGLKAFQSKDYPAAIQAFQAALEGFQAEGDELAAAETANNLSVAHLKAGDAQAAWSVIKYTDQVFMKSGDQRRLAMTLGNQAAALESIGELNVALAKYSECADLLKTLGDQETRSSVLRSLSEVQMRTGHQLEAMATMDAALNHQKRLSPVEQFLKKLLKIPMNMLNR
jgi:tetratricopeptide (TPR) repeat protein